jgi:riboflavin biosynthesis pyrimidine reductase
MDQEAPGTALYLAWPPPLRRLSAEGLADAYRPFDSGPAGPSVAVNFVTSVDGAVTVDGRTAGLAGPADKAVFRLLRRGCDALLVGAGTLRNERYGALRAGPADGEWRLARGLAEHPLLVVVSGSLDLAPDLAALAGAPVRPVVATHRAAPAARRRELEAVADVVPVGEDAVDLAALLRLLGDRGVARVLCEGGPLLLGTLTAADLVDDMCLTLSPVLAGAGAGRITAGPVSALRDLTLRHVLAAGDEVLLRYVRPGVGGPLPTA